MVESRQFYRSAITMNIPKRNFNFHIALKRKAKKRRDVFSPAHDWFVLLSLSALLYALSIGYGLWTYWRIQNAGSLAQPAATSDAVMRTYAQDLAAVLTFAQQDKEKFDASKTGVVPPDPSM